MKNLKYFVFVFGLLFISLSVVKAEATCVYKEGSFGVTFTTNNGKLNYVNKSFGDIKFSFNSPSIKYNDFVSGSSFICPSSVYIELHQTTGSKIIEIKDIAISEKTNTFALSNVASESNISGTAISGSTTPAEEKQKYENDSAYIEAKKDADLYCSSSNFGYQDDAKCAQAQEKMQKIKSTYVGSVTSGDGHLDLEQPCQGRVLGVFTTIGWVFFIVKIVVPIILIVLGSIDLARAVVSSKDDEIKKSVKTLVIRAIAGIIIFFIPTILNFIINVIGNNADEVYNDKFGVCTSCMLKPNQDNCPSLLGW